MNSDGSDEWDSEMYSMCRWVCCVCVFSSTKCVYDFCVLSKTFPTETIFYSNMLNLLFICFVPYFQVCPSTVFTLRSGECCSISLQTLFLKCQIWPWKSSTASHTRYVVLVSWDIFHHHTQTLKAGLIVRAIVESNECYLCMLHTGKLKCMAQGQLERVQLLLVKSCIICAWSKAQVAKGLYFKLWFSAQEITAQPNLICWATLTYHSLFLQAWIWLDSCQFTCVFFIYLCVFIENGSSGA